MLSETKSPLSKKISQIIFSVLIAVMMLGPLASYFSKGYQQPVLLKNSTKDLTANDIIKKDSSFPKLIAALPGQTKEDATAILSNYLARFSYQDFFSKYDMNLSDELSWSLIFKDIGEDISVEMIAQIEDQVLKNFGSKRNFLNHAKNQLLTSYVKNTMHELSFAPQSDAFIDKAASTINRHIDVYTFNVDSLIKNIGRPTEEELLAFYQNNQSEYLTEPTVNISYIKLPSQKISLNDEDKENLKNELTSEGYTSIDENVLHDYAFFKYLEQLDNKVEYIDSTDDLLAEVNQQGFNFEKNDFQNGFFKLHEVSDLFESPFAQQLIAQLDDKAGWTIVPGQQSAYLVKMNSQTPAVLQSYHDVAPQILSSLLRKKALEKAEELALQMQQDIITGQQSAIYEYDQVHAYNVTDIFNNQEHSFLTGQIKVAISSLLDPRVNPEKSTKMIVQHNSGQVHLIALKSVDFGATYDNASVILNDYVYNSLYNKAFNDSVVSSFGYEIQPGFWKVLENQQAREIS